jgi:isoquinoline 1-oxidoreductase beta subunit
MSFQTTRRALLGGLAAGSLVLAARIVGARTEVAAADAAAWEPDLFLTIAPDGTVTIVAHRSEMGTGIRTALPQVLADELGADWGRVRLEQAIGDRRLGDQNTDGSRSVRQFFGTMREIGAVARTALERAAARRWGVDPAECRGRDHEVTHRPTGRTLAYAGLIADAASQPLPAPEEVELLPREEWRYIGADVAIADLNAIVAGGARFGIDARRPGQLFCVIARPPVLGADVANLSDEAARAVAGVVDVIRIPRFEGAHAFQPLGGVAVLADSTWAAIAGRKALEIEWTESDHDDYESESYRAELDEAVRKVGRVHREQGDAPKLLSEAAERIEADYHLPLLAHAPMEPPCAVAQVEFDGDGRAVSCEAWAATQNPQAAQGQVAATLGIDAEDVTVHVTLLGGGFGRKSKPDYVAEAAWLSARVARPVHVTWTREDDIRHDYFHTVSSVHLEACLGEDGMPSAWLQRAAYPTISSTFAAGADRPSGGELGMGFTDVPFDVPNLRVESGRAEAHVRIGWMRSVAHIQQALAICCFADELAHRAGRDPLDFLLELLGPDRVLEFDAPSGYEFDVGRLKHVARRAAELADWGRSTSDGRGLGIAAHRSFLGYHANVVEVEVDRRGKLTIPKVWSVLDAGTVVNPDRVHAQLEGAAVFGASLALFGEITARDGRVTQSNFDGYRVARINEAPKEIVTEIVASEAPPSGVGETGVPAFAPALLNAVFAATGVRVRRLPLSRTSLRRNG